MRFSLNELEKTIILTAPHARCLIPRDPMHRCDTRAEALQQALSVQLSEQGVDVRSFVGDMNRAQCDLNRDVPCNRESVFHRLVDEALAEPGTVMLLDCHSYPDAHEPGIELYLMDYVRHADDGASAYVISLQRALQEIVDVVPIYLTTGTDEILMHSARMHVPAILIELNETVGDDRLVQLARRIAEWANLVAYNGVPEPRPPSDDGLDRDNWTVESWRLDYAARLEKCQLGVDDSDMPIAYERLLVPNRTQTLVIVRDDLLCAGTKSRIMDNMLVQLVKRDKRVFVYVATYIGSAQIVVARAVQAWNERHTSQLECVILNEKAGEGKPYPRVAADYGAQMLYLNEEERRRKLAHYTSTYDVAILPHGLRTEQTVDELAELMRPVAELGPFDAAYCALGSGAMIEAMQRAQLARLYYAVDIFQRTASESGELAGEATVLRPSMRFSEPAPLEETPHFVAASRYDAKVWHFIVNNNLPEDARILWWDVL